MSTGTPEGTQGTHRPVNNNYFIYQFLSPFYIYRTPNEVNTGINMQSTPQTHSNENQGFTRSTGSTPNLFSNIFDFATPNPNINGNGVNREPNLATQAQNNMNASHSQPNLQQPSFTNGNGNATATPNINNNYVNPNDFLFFLDPLSLLFGQFFNNLPRQQQSLQGQPPASKIAMESLKIVSPKSRLIKLQPTCSICLDDFDSTPEKVIRSMPCGHVYHEDCLFKWLEKSNTCANCRYEIDTDNPEYNEALKKRMADRHPVFTEHECALSLQGSCDYEDQNGEYFDVNEEEEQKHIIKTSCGCTFHDTCLRTALLVRGYNVPEIGGHVEFRCPKCNKESNITFSPLEPLNHKEMNDNDNLSSLKTSSKDEPKVDSTTKTKLVNDVTSTAATN